jgi:hypothetical protein
VEGDQLVLVMWKEGGQLVLVLVEGDHHCFCTRRRATCDAPTRPVNLEGDQSITSLAEGDQSIPSSVEGDQILLVNLEGDQSITTLQRVRRPIYSDSATCSATNLSRLCNVFTTLCNLFTGCVLHVPPLAPRWRVACLCFFAVRAFARTPEHVLTERQNTCSRRTRKPLGWRCQER